MDGIRSEYFADFLDSVYNMRERALYIATKRIVETNRCRKLPDLIIGEKSLIIFIFWGLDENILDYFNCGTKADSPRFVLANS